MSASKTELKVANKSTKKAPSSTKRETSTPEWVPGFDERLKVVCHFLGLRLHGGLYAELSRMAGMTIPAAKLMFTKKRPPTILSNYQRLTDGLTTMLNEQGLDINEDALSAYLLLNEGTPIPRQLNVRPKRLMDEFDQVALAEIHVAIHAHANKCGINLFKDFSVKDTAWLMDRVLKYCLSTKPLDTTSKDFKQTVESTLHIVKNQLL